MGRKIPKTITIVAIHGFFLIFGGLAFCPTARAGQLEDFFKKGQQAYAQGKYEKAIEWYEKVVEVNENFAPAYHNLGLAHQAAGTPLRDVVWFFQVAEKLDPANPAISVDLCKVYFEARALDEAEQACRHALELDPTSGSAQLTLAWVYLTGEKQPYDAIYYFKKVLERVQNPMIDFGLGMAYVQAGENALALEMITTLRSDGENDLAMQLENALRSMEETSASPETAAASSHEMPQRQKGLLIQSSSPTPVPQRRRAPVSGQMQIRLKGRLFDANEK